MRGKEIVVLQLAMPSFTSEFKTALRSPLPYILWAVLSLMLTLGGPFGTIDVAFTKRAIYWCVIVAGSIVVGKAIRVAIEIWLEPTHPLLEKVVVALLMSFALSPPIWFYSAAYFGESAVPPLRDFFIFVVIVTFGVQLIRWALDEHFLRFGSLDGRAPAMAAETEDTASDPAAPPPRLLERIETDLQGNILRISARDHYLDVFTDKGRAELLLRFSDALTEVDGLEGAQVHRSHWVAWEAVIGSERDGARLFLRLADGDRVPVSRRFHDTVANQGLL